MSKNELSVSNNSLPDQNIKVKSTSGKKGRKSRKKQNRTKSNGANDINVQNNSRDVLKGSCCIFSKNWIQNTRQDSFLKTIIPYKLPINENYEYVLTYRTKKAGDPENKTRVKKSNSVESLSSDVSNLSFDKSALSVDDNGVLLVNVDMNMNITNIESDVPEKLQSLNINEVGIENYKIQSRGDKSASKIKLERPVDSVVKIENSKFLESDRNSNDDVVSSTTNVIVEDSDDKLIINDCDNFDIEPTQTMNNDAKKVLEPGNLNNPKSSKKESSSKKKRSGKGKNVEVMESDPPNIPEQSTDLESSGTDETEESDKSSRVNSDSNRAQSKGKGN